MQSQGISEGLKSYIKGKQNLAESPARELFCAAKAKAEFLAVHSERGRISMNTDAVRGGE